MTLSSRVVIANLVSAMQSTAEDLKIGVESIGLLIKLKDEGKIRLGMFEQTASLFSKQCDLMRDQIKAYRALKRLYESGGTIEV